MLKKVLLILLGLVEIILLYWMYLKYGQIENKILLVQGQFAYRYANLHDEWLRVSGALVLLTLAFPFTVYLTWRTFRRS